MSITRIYAADIVKSARDADGILRIYGKATSPALDLDQQICDPDWLAKAMPRWFETAANIREMHGNIAAGKGTHLERTPDDSWMLSAKIVDPSTAQKFEEGVLTGLSVGIKNARVIKDAKAPGGRIVDGVIVEVSGVDRPCNEECTVELVKAAKGGVDVAPEYLDEEHGVMWVATPESAPSQVGDLAKAAVLDAVAETREAAKGLSLTVDRERLGAAPAAFDRDLALAVAGYAASGDRAAVLALLPADTGKAVSPDGMQDEAPDIAGGKQVIDLLGQLIAAEAAELSAGYLDESCDIRILLQAVEAVSCWLGKEQAAMTTPDKPYAQDDEQDTMTYVGLDVEADLFKAVSAQQRRQYAKSGVAMPNGDFPIPDEDHLRSAVGRLGNYKGDKDAARKHIITRAKALDLVRLLPDDWGVPGADAEKKAGGATAGIAGVTGAAGSASGVAVATAGTLDGAQPTPTPDSGADDVRGLPARPGSDAGRVLDDADAARAKAAKKAAKKARKNAVTTSTGQPNPAATTTAATAAKAATPDAPQGATINDQTNVADIVKAAVAEATRPYEERIEALNDQLAKVLATPMPGGPVLIAPTTGAPERTANIAKAAQFRAIADQSGDPSVARAYRAKAAQLEAAERQ